jgi:hypothetical protein
MAWFSLTNFLSGTPTKVEFKFYDDSPFTLQLQNYTDAVNTNKARLFTTIQNSFVKEERPLTRPELEDIIAMKKELDALELENELRMANSEVEKNTKSCLVNQKSNSTINCRPEHRIWNSYKTTTCRSQKWAGQKTSNCVANRQKRLINTYKNTPQKELAKIYNEKVVVFLDKIKNIVPATASVPAPVSMAAPVAPPAAPPMPKKVVAPPPVPLAKSLGGGKTRKNRSKKGKKGKTRRY